MTSIVTSPPVGTKAKAHATRITTMMNEITKLTKNLFLIYHSSLTSPLDAVLFLNTMSAYMFYSFSLSFSFLNGLLIPIGPSTLWLEMKLKSTINTILF